MSNDNEKIELKIPIFEILLGLGVIVLIVGILAPFQLIEFLGFELWFDPNLSMICLPLGGGLIFGYITRKILPHNTKAYWLGFCLGIIGLIIALCIKPKVNINNNRDNKYEEIQKLAELKQNGILTEAEFETEKSKILKGE